MCTIFVTKLNKKKIIVGRNFDWLQLGGKIHFNPASTIYGTRTLGFCMIEQEGDQLPYEGLNEKGLFVGMTAIHKKLKKNNANFKATINDLGLIRFILERASNVDQALKIAKQFKIDYRQKEHFPPVHYLFADAQGNVSIYEEDTYEFCKKFHNKEWKVITNFSLTKKTRCKRYKIVANKLSNNYVSGMDSAMKLLYLVKQELKNEFKTVYSVVFDLISKNINLSIEQNYHTIYQFNLQKELRKGKHFLDFGKLKLQHKKI